jgi:hypothetical protein
VREKIPSGGKHERQVDTFSQGLLLLTEIEA